MFITDIRNCKHKEEEEQRVEKELANIRSKFKSDKTLTDYDKKKYVWKLLYIHMLGYDVEFGHVQAIDLISAPKYTEKQVGYAVTSVLVNENNDFLRLAINAVRNDILSRNEANQCLALAFAANVGGPEFSEALASDVMKLLVSNASRPVVKKKAALCLLRLYRKNPDIISADLWSTKMASLLDERDIGTLGTCVSLLTAIAARDGTGFEGCVPKLVAILERLAHARSVPQDHTYYGIPSPWLQIRIMRCLQYFPQPEDPELSKALISVVKAVLTGTDINKNVNKNNATHAILFEALALVMQMDYNQELLSRCLSILGKFIAVREPNIRYLGLENMCRLALLPDCLPSIRQHTKTVVGALKDSDISIRRRALDLMFTMCDHENAREIVSELLEYLKTADFAMREVLALKIAILAEKFAPDLMWYVDVAMELVETAGDYISEDVWFRIVQLVTNHKDMQDHAVRHMYAALSRGGSAEPLIETAAYILGEFSRAAPDVSPVTIFQLLSEKLPVVSAQTKGIILNAFAKLALHSDSDILKDSIQNVFARYQRFADTDLQQRAVEYAGLTEKAGMRDSILGMMPPFPEHESGLLKRLAAATGGIADDSSSHMHKGEDEFETAAPEHGAGAGTAGGLGGYGAADLIEGLAIDDGPPTAAAPSHQPAAPSSDPLMDLYSLDAQGAPPPPPPPEPAAMADDAFGGGAGLADLITGDVGPGAGASERPITPLADLGIWFRRLVAVPQGVLYEDDYLQIGLKQEYRPPQARLGLFFGNKSTSPLEGLQVHVGPASNYNAQLAGAPPPVVAPKRQEQVSVMVAALAPALTQPTLSFKYRLGSQEVSQTLNLPCVNSKFLVPVESMDQSGFFAAWQAVPAPPQKLQEVVSRPHPMQPSQVAAMLRSLNFGVVPGIDPNQNNVVGGANYAVPCPFNPLCLCRIEVEPNSKLQLRVTVSSGDATLSSTLKEAIKQQILAV